MRELYKPSENFPTFENWASKTIFPLFENFPTFQKHISHFSHFWDFLDCKYISNNRSLV